MAVPAPTPVPDLPKPAKREIKPNTKRHPLPSGLKEVKPNQAILTLTAKSLPWLNGRDQPPVPLALVTLSGTENRQFYLGSFIGHPDLLEAARSLTPSQSDSVNQLFYTCLPDLVRQGFHPAVDLVKHPRGGVNILYAANKGGQRVYFMRFDPINNLAVIVKVAACDKNKEDLVLGVLTTKSQKDIKKFGKL